jgi:uncharacterized protein YndB with AHSA1/START domain
MARSTFVYVTYIRTTQQKLWSALTTDTEFMKQYWFGVHCVSEWTAGSSWQMRGPDGELFDDGGILESDPPRKLVIRWQHQRRPEIRAEGESRCTYELEAIGPTVRLQITHTIERDPSKFIEAVSGGWPKILSNLKSLLETGSTALLEAYPREK